MADRLVALVDAGHVTAYSWAPLTRWRCLRCDLSFLTRELAPRCPVCGWVDDGT
jgi:rubrerythrin